MLKTFEMEEKNARMGLVMVAVVSKEQDSLA